jgi:hypothetical protein
MIRDVSRERRNAAEWIGGGSVISQCASIGALSHTDAAMQRGWPFTVRIGLCDKAVLGDVCTDNRAWEVENLIKCSVV